MWFQKSSHKVEDVPFYIFEKNAAAPFSQDLTPQLLPVKFYSQI